MRRGHDRKDCLMGAHVLRFMACMVMFLLWIVAPAMGQEYVLYPGFPPLKQSQAFTEFLKSPRNDYAKLLFLIDRFGDADIKVIYNGYEFEALFAAGVARWFLKIYYRGQDPKTWILQWCNRSIPNDELIRVKLPDRRYLLSRDVLSKELAQLQEAIASL